MSIIAIDTATARVAVAAAAQSGEILFAASGRRPRSHGEEIGPLLQRAMAVGAPTRIAVGCGPGSFTGLRVGLAAARTMAWARDLPLDGFCTLDALAGRGWSGIAVTDARRNELYWARYEAGRRVDGPAVGTRAAVARIVADAPDAADAAAVVGDVDLLGTTDRRSRGSFAIDPARLGALAAQRARSRVVDVAEPIYLRQPDVSGAATPAETLGLRAPRADDVGQILAIEADRYGPDAWSHQQVADEIAQHGHGRWYAIAERGGRVVGYAGITTTYPDADLQTVTVARGTEGEGLGGRLLDAVLGAGRALGVSRMFLEVRAGNRRAQALYGSRGFERISVRRRYYADAQDALIWRRRLGSPTSMEDHHG